MVIGVVSDTHRHQTAVEKIIERCKKFDVLIHLGDNLDDAEKIRRNFNGKFINVRGNCDFTQRVPSEQFVEIDGKNIFLTHGHVYNVKSSLLRLKYKAQEIGADIVLYGHTHIAEMCYEDGIWFINPGSPALPRDGFYSMASIDIKEGKIIPQIISL